MCTYMLAHVISVCVCVYAFEQEYVVRVCMCDCMCGCMHVCVCGGVLVRPFKYSEKVSGESHVTQERWGRLRL